MAQEISTNCTRLPPLLESEETYTLELLLYLNQTRFAGALKGQAQLEGGGAQRYVIMNR